MDAKVPKNLISIEKKSKSLHFCNLVPPLLPTLQGEVLKATLATDSVIGTMVTLFISISVIKQQ